MITFGNIGEIAARCTLLLVSAGALVCCAQEDWVSPPPPPPGSARIITDTGLPPPGTPLVRSQCKAKWVGNGALYFRGACPAIIQLPGFRTAQVVLTNGAVVVLKRLGINEGSTISITALKAPAKARKAYETAASASQARHWKAAEAELERAVVIYPEYAAAWSDSYRSSAGKRSARCRIRCGSNETRASDAEHVKRVLRELQSK